jgi:hypothetical protein
MSEILYQRVQSHGPVVRIRRITEVGAVPVRAVLEVDRRSGRSRGSGGVGFPPPLMAVEGDTDEAVVASLRPFADEDAALARLGAQQRTR